MRGAEEDIERVLSRRKAMPAPGEAHLPRAGRVAIAWAAGPNLFCAGPVGARRTSSAAHDRQQAAAC